ncbi:MAG TPA: Dam family site-specific DNA-(adenine-N6)-methyltransferase [Solirubrobacterales bacterium]|nr:Dam family site-specific DNA-(adenine-N6)-methyltransferase [Solirubrobacterales bacterium]
MSQTALPVARVADASDPGPFLRWAGGKTRLLRHLLPYVPERFDGYFEPFLGGGAVFFATRQRAGGPIVLSDLNEELVNIWRTVRDEPDGFLEALVFYEGKNDEASYYEVREADAPAEPIQRAARFAYLNQTAWNGLWRVNRWGRFNVPWGNRPFRGYEAEAIGDLSAVLQEVEIELADFRDILGQPKRGDFVYLDPPYLPVSDTSKFSGYTEKRFRAADLEELASICRELTKNGVAWVLSNRDTPLVRELFADHEIVRMTTRRSVAAQNRRDIEPSQSPEAIVVGRV